VECKAEQLGLPVEDTEGIENQCPAGVCLGQSCREEYPNCLANCNADYRFVDTDEDCDPEPLCSISDLDDCDGSHCAYCPSDHSLPCTLVAGVDRDDCDNNIGCELPDGRVLFGLSEDECRDYDASCSITCPGDGCLSLSETSGVCVVDVPNFPTCQNVAKSYSIETVWWDGDSCLIIPYDTREACEDFAALSLLSTHWDRCEDWGADECGDTTVATTQRYLECYVSNWRECTSQQECESSGECSDRKYATLVTSATGEYPIEVQTGVCFNSGFHDNGGGDLPVCLEDMDRPGIGCRDLLFDDDADCTGFIDSQGLFAFREWVIPAVTEENCRNDAASRFGCLLPGPEKQLLWLNASECECRGGSAQFAWEWTPGQWRGGVPRSLTWMEAREEPLYEKQSSLSFITLEEWEAESVEEQFLYILRSDVICQSNFVSYSLTTLVCDCYSTEDETGDSCYEQNENNRENLVGISAVCEGERSVVKGPSGRVTFAEFAIRRGCSLLNLSIVNEAWFDATVADVAVSFRFEDHNTRGTVRNDDQATVGELVGDGTVISFEKPGRMETFEVCLRVTQTEPDNAEYSRRDFGTSTSSYEYIVPAGLQKVNVQDLGTAQFWCSRVEYDDVAVDPDGVVRLFPIYRERDYEDQDEEYVSYRTKVLMYVLGCFYAVDLCLFIFYFAHKAEIGKRSQKRRQIAFPLSALFFVLCVFRICFMFMYPNGVFYQEPLSEFVVFEIPTFLLFTMVIISIGFWKSLSNRTHFFVKDSKFLVYVGVVLVWCLWIVVTVVYSEVVLESDSGESPCVGRVPDNNDELEENTRILTIVYQSIIVAVTFFLAAIFSFYTRKLLAAAKNISRVKKFILFIGGLITFSFLIRCILFVIILAVEFTSSIYMFIALFLTEVMLMLLCALQFNNWMFYKFGSSYAGNSATSRGTKSKDMMSGDTSDSKELRMKTDMNTVMDD